MSNLDSRSLSVKPDDAVTDLNLPVITVTFGASKTTTSWTDRRTMPFGAFAAMFGKPAIGPKDGTCYVPAVFSGAVRKMQFATEIGIAVLDSDCGHTIAEIAAGLREAGFAGFIHSTASHLTRETEISAKSYDRWRIAEGAAFDDTVAAAKYLKTYKGYLDRISEGACIAGKTVGGKEYIFSHRPIPKYRVVVPLARPWLAADHVEEEARRADWRGRILALAKRLKLHHDQSCTDTSRLFYFPRVPTQAALEAFECEFIAGAALDIHALEPIIDTPARAGATRQRARKQGAPDRAPLPLPETVDDPDRHTVEGFDLRAWSTGAGRGFEIVKALRARGTAPIRVRSAGVKRHITCAFDDYHTKASDGTGTFVVNASQRESAGMPAIKTGFIVHCSHDACRGRRDRLDHVKRMVELEWLTVADLTDERFLSVKAAPLPELPPFDVPTLDGPDGALALTRVVAAYFYELECDLERGEWREARLLELLAEAEDSREEWLDEEGQKKERQRLGQKASREARKRFGVSKSEYLRLQIAATAGIGKTRIMAHEYRRRPRLWKHPIEFYGKTTKNAREFVEAINAEPMPPGMPRAVLLSGYTYSDEDMPKPACLKHEIVAEAYGKTVAGIYRSFCDNGTVQCEFHGKCRYTAERLDKSPKVRAFPHASLAVFQAEDISPPDPALVIVDESCVDVVTKRIDVNIPKITDPETYTDEPHNVQEHLDLAETAVELIRTVPDVPGKLMEGDEPRRKKRQEELGIWDAAREKDLASIPNRLRRAATAAAAGGGMLADVNPSDSVETVRAKLADITGDSHSRAVAALLRQLARDTEEGWPTSLGVEFIPAERMKTDKTKEKDGKDRLIVRGLHQLPFSKETPLILIDADAIRDVNEAIFGRMRWEEIRCQRIAHFTQASDFKGSTSTLSPYEKAGSDNAKRAANRRAEIAAFAGEMAKDGGRVFVAAVKDVRIAITGEKPNENGKVLVNFHDPRGFEISHHGVTIGRNEWHLHDVGIQIGREEIPCNAAEGIARAVYANARGYGFEPLNLPGSYQHMRRRRSPGSGEFVEMRGHPDPRVQAILELKRERAVVQNIDRLRLLFPDERRVRWYILCSLPLPGIVPDKLDTLSNILAGGSRLERAARRGLVTTNAKAMAAVHGDLYESVEAAEHEIKQGHVAQVLENKESGEPANKDSSICKTATFFVFNGLAPTHVAGRFRLRAPEGWVPKWSAIAVSPYRYRRPDITIHIAIGAHPMARVEFDGDVAIVVNVARRQDDAADRIAELTTDAVPPAEERTAFIAAALEFFDALDGHPMVPDPEWWAKPLPAASLEPLVPPGRRLAVWHTGPAGRVRIWFFPDAAGDGAWLDGQFSPIDPPDHVREAGERFVANAEAAST